MHSELVYLNLFSAVYYLALIIYLIVQRKNYKGSGTLIGIMSINAYALINNSLILSLEIINWTFVFWFTFIFVTLFPVFFRMHIHKLLGIRVRLDLLTSTICILWALGIYGAIQFYGLSDVEQFKYLKSILERNFPGDFQLLNFSFYILVLIFFVATGIVVFKKEVSTGRSFENLFVQSRKYVRQFWLLNVGMYCVVVVMLTFIPEFYVEYAAIPVCMNILFLFLVLNLRHYSQTYSPESNEETNDYENEISPELLSLIEKTISLKDHFSNPDFNLDEISEIVGRPKNEISSTINRGLKIGFNDFLNAKRIEYAKVLLKDFDQTKDTIEGIGYDCGFNSKASFYRSFKKFTSTTPTEFIQSQNN